MAIIEEGAMKLHIPHNSIPYLHTEIIIVILSRLPIKSLLQFRSVSKSWRSIITDPKFAKIHLNFSSKNDQDAYHRLIFTSSIDGRITIKKCHLSTVLNTLSVNPTTTYARKNQSWYTNLSLVGTINGLICIAIGKLDVFLLNPSTQISNKLPRPPSFRKLLNVVHAFGYDESTRDYIVVGAFGTNGKTALLIYKVMVYSLRRGCWRSIPDFPQGHTPFNTMGRTGMFLNGAIHWGTCVIQNSDKTLSSTNNILSFDLVRETYSEVPQPNYGEDELVVRLDVLEKCLCLLSDCSQNYLNVWMMKEYGVRKSWTKLASFSYLTNLDHLEYPVLLYMSKKGEILYALGSRILLYDLNRKSFRISGILNFDVRLGAHIYTASLVSPLIPEDQEQH